MATFGQYLYGGETLSKMIELEEAKGSKVIAAINGDFTIPLIVFQLAQ